MTMPKNPGRVEAGKRRQAQLREQLGDDGYRAYQRARRDDALARHPDLLQRAAAAGNAAQYRAWGAEGYRAQRCEAYACAVARHGREMIHGHIRAAHELRRRQRLDHPTRGEALLRQEAARLGLTVILPQTPFDYLAWRDDPTIWLDVDATTAVVEATLGPYACDLLLPTRRIVLEVLGGIHCLQRAHDATRRAYLAAHGLTVIELNDTPDEPLTAQRIRAVLGAILV